MMQLSHPARGIPWKTLSCQNLDDFEYLEPDSVQDRGEGKDDAYWLTRLAFLALALIWAYLKLKKAMYTDMDELASCMNSANIFQGLIDSLTRDDLGLPTLEISLALTIPLTLHPGTGLDVRVNPNWKTHLSHQVTTIHCSTSCMSRFQTSDDKQGP